MTTSTPLETLNLSPRPYNALTRAGIETVEQLQAAPDLHLLRGIGKGCLKEIQESLKRFQPPAAPADRKEPNWDIVFNLSHDWNGIFAWCDAESCPHCLCPPRNEITRMVAEEIEIALERVKKLPWYKRLFKLFP